MILESILSEPASWQSKTSVCRTCKARMLYRKEDPARILVKHERSCIAVLETVMARKGLGPGKTRR